MALVHFLRKFGRAILTKVAGLLPTHTRRSEEMERFQQLSTPLPMLIAALSAAQITQRDLVLGPSAGTGLLAILAEIAGGSLALNELADTRAEFLCDLFPGRPVTIFDAAQIDDHLNAGLGPSVILMNPPFSAVANGDGRSTKSTARHLRSALARLAPGGRLVAITGASFAPDVPAWSETFGRLTETAHLVFTGAVSGAAFAKHGTSFETRISVFDKCRGGEQGGIHRRSGAPDIAGCLRGRWKDLEVRSRFLSARARAKAHRDSADLFGANLPVDLAHAAWPRSPKQTLVRNRRPTWPLGQALWKTAMPVAAGQ